MTRDEAQTISVAFIAATAVFVANGQWAFGGVAALFSFVLWVSA